MCIEINDLESARFGIVAARLSDPGAVMADVDAAAVTAKVDMLTTRVEVSDLPRVHALEAGGFRLMDTLVYYERSLDEVPEQSTSLDLRRAAAEDVAPIGTLAQAAFTDYIGHYHADPHLSSTAADAAYVEWAEVSTARQTPDTPVLMAEDETGVVGFLTLRRNATEEFEIVLNAVHPAAQGKGVYTALARAALLLAKDAGARRMIVSTQINNYAVQRVWTRLGFFHSSSLYTFHKWYDR